MKSLPFRIIRSGNSSNNQNASNSNTSNRFTNFRNRSNDINNNNSVASASSTSSADGLRPTAASGTGLPCLDCALLCLPVPSFALDTSVNSTRSAPAHLGAPRPPNNPMLRRSHADPPGQLPASSQVQSSQSLTAPPHPSTAASSNNSRASNNNTSSSTTSRPGAYKVTRTSSGPALVYRVAVPAGIQPGADFHVHAGPRRVRARCPPNSRPGQSLQITLPPESITNFARLRAAPLTASYGKASSGGAISMKPDIQRINKQAREHGGSVYTQLVTIPPNIYPGMQFTTKAANGQTFKVHCPPSAGPNMEVRIVLPIQHEEPEAMPTTQVFEVVVPPGVQSGQPFALAANGQRVLVTCPPNVMAGQKIRFQLPVSQMVGNIQLAYESEKGGWKRTIRTTDLKFQWVRLDDTGGQGEIDLDQHFDFIKSAYVRKITFMEGNDARMRTGTVELVPASEATVDSRLVVQNRTLMSYADISQMQGKTLEEKKVWFDGICKQLRTTWEDGYIKICVRRSHLLLDSMEAVMALSREDMRKPWRVEFLNEEALDVGGPMREWFELVSKQVFDPDCGLWVPSINNQACVDINPGSGMCNSCSHCVSSV